MPDEPRADAERSVVAYWVPEGRVRLVEVTDEYRE
jgi:hypothetical protein